MRVSDCFASKTYHVNYWVLIDPNESKCEDICYDIKSILKEPNLFAHEGISLLAFL